MAKRKDSTLYSNEPDYYKDIVEYRHADLHGPVKARSFDLKFVPKGNEMNAIYHTPLTELLSRRELPFNVKLNEDIVLTLDESKGTRIARRGSIITLHVIIRPKRVYATDAAGGRLVLPLFARQLYDVLPIEPSHDDKVFESTAAVMQSNPLPKRLMIINAEYSDIPEEAQESGEVIEVSHIERHGQLRVLIGKSTITRKQFTFSEKMASSTYTTMTCKEPLTLSEIVKRYTLPLRIRKTEDRSCCFTIQECKEEAQVICTVPLSNQVHAIPLTSPIRVEYIKDQQHSSITEIVTPLYPLLNWTLGVCEVGRNVLPATQQGIPQPILKVLCEWMNSKEGFKLATRVSEGEVKSQGQTIAEQKRRIQSLEKRLSKPELQPPIPVLPQKPIGLRVNSTRPAIARRTDVQKSNETYTSVSYPPKPAPRRHTVFPSRDQSEVKKLTAEIQELQEDRQKHLKKISSLQQEVDRLKSTNTKHHEYEVTQLLPTQGETLKNGSVEDVVKFLCSLGLTAESEAFEKELVDGALLLELNEEIMHNELGLSKLKAKRILLELKKPSR